MNVNKCVCIIALSFSLIGCNEPDVLDQSVETSIKRDISDFMRVPVIPLSQDVLGLWRYPNSKTDYNLAFTNALHYTVDQLKSQRHSDDHKVRLVSYVMLMMRTRVSIKDPLSDLMPIDKNTFIDKDTLSDLMPIDEVVHYFSSAIKSESNPANRLFLSSAILYTDYTVKAQTAIDSMPTNSFMTDKQLIAPYTSLDQYRYYTQIKILFSNANQYNRFQFALSYLEYLSDYYDKVSSPSEYGKGVRYLSSYTGESDAYFGAPINIRRFNRFLQLEEVVLSSLGSSELEQIVDEIKNKKGRIPLAVLYALLRDNKDGVVAKFDIVEQLRGARKHNDKNHIQSIVLATDICEKRKSVLEQYMGIDLIGGARVMPALREALMASFVDLPREMIAPDIGAALYVMCHKVKFEEVELCSYVREGQSATAGNIYGLSRKDFVIEIIIVNTETKEEISKTFIGRAPGCAPKVREGAMSFQGRFPKAEVERWILTDVVEMMSGR